MQTQPKDNVLRNATYDNGTLIIKNGSLHFSQILAGNGIIRAKLRKDYEPYADRNIALVFRANDSRTVAAGYNGQGFFFLGRMNKRWNNLSSVMINTHNDSDYFELALAVLENHAFVYKDGQRILAAELDVPMLPGTPAVSIHDRTGLVTGFFRDVQYQPLSAQAIHFAVKPQSPEVQDRYQRDAFKVVRRLGGYCALNGSSDHWSGPLPKEPFRITKLSLPNLVELKGTLPLEVLRWCTDLDTIYLNSSHLTTLDINWVENCKMLKHLDIASTRVSPSITRYLKPCTELKKLYCWGIPFNDDDLLPLQDKPLTHADFSTYGLSDQCGKIVKTWSSLEHLRVAFSSISDLFLADVATLQFVRHLHVYANPKITDRGIEHLLKCPKLANLHIGGTSVTDACLATLAKIPTLKRLDVSDTKVTTQGIAKFQAIRPDCIVIGKND